MVGEALLAASVVMWLSYGYHEFRKRQRTQVGWARGVAAGLEKLGLEPRFDRRGVAWTDNGSWVLLLDPPRGTTASGTWGHGRVVLTAPPVHGLPKLTLRRSGATAVVDTLRLNDIKTGDRVFDLRWTVESPDPVAARLALGPGVRQAMDRLDPFTVDIDQQLLELSWQEGNPPVTTMLERLHASQDLAKALRKGTWTEIGATLWLQSPTHRELHGTLDGIVVAARASQNGTRVRAFKRSRLHAIHRNLPLEGAFPSQNPVLDQLIRVGGDPELRDRLQDPALVEPLLEVVHGWPGSFVDAEGVTLVSDEVLIERLAEALRTAVGLARALP